MNSVGIDISKGKSMVVALRPMGELVLTPKEYPHTVAGLEQMAYDIISLGENTKVTMEATGRYHEPVAAALHEYGIFVCVLNPILIHQSGGGSGFLKKLLKSGLLCYTLFSVAKKILDFFILGLDFYLQDEVLSFKYSRQTH